MESQPFIEALFGPASGLARAIFGYEPRPAQSRMATLVTDAVRQERHLAVEAGTGTGKTLAYLLPLLGMEQRAIISTATKALQDQILGKDLPLLRKVVGRPFSAVVLKGRANYLCIHRYRLFRAGGMRVMAEERPLLGEVEAWSRETRTGDRDELSDLPERVMFWRDMSSTGSDCLGQQCPDHGECFLMRARNRAREADLVVVNHHLYFADLAVKEGGFGEILPKHEVAIFDEAHQVPDVVTRYFGLELSNHQLRELAKDCEREFAAEKVGDPQVLDAATRLDLAAGELRLAFPDLEVRASIQEEAVQTCGRALVETEKNLYRFLESLEPHRERSPGLAACARRAEQMLLTSGQIRALDDPGRVYWYETRGKGVFLMASPLEVGPTLQEALYPRLKSVVYTSATLATSQDRGAFRFFMEQVGLDETRADAEKLPPVFDYRRQSLLYLPEHLPDPNLPAFADAALEEIFTLLGLSRGRAFCLFTSHRMLEFARRQLQGRLPYPLLVQGDRPKRALLEAFTGQTDSVLLATSSFWEGVDVPGEALSMVIIDRLPFASPGDPLVAARQRFLEAQGGDSFNDLSLPKAILSLKQGLGRLLRRGDDRGVMVVLDNRLVRKSYGRRFLAGLPPVPLTRSRDEVRWFFGNE